MIKSNQMRGAGVISAMVLISILSLSQAHGAITLTFSGIYDTFNTTLYANDSDPGAPDPSHITVFGLTQPTAAVSYTFTFSDLATPAVLANGTAVTSGGGTGTLNRTWYGYSVSDITNVSASIGGSTWTASDTFGNFGQLFGPGNVGADKSIWFDQDIAVVAPTRAVFDLDNSGGNFFGTTKGYLIAGDEFTSNAGIVDSAASAFIGQYTSNSVPDASREAGATSFTITSSVPEPSRAMFLLMGLASLKLRRKRF